MGNETAVSFANERMLAVCNVYLTIPLKISSG